MGAAALCFYGGAAAAADTVADSGDAIRDFVDVGSVPGAASSAAGMAARREGEAAREACGILYGTASVPALRLMRGGARCCRSRARPGSGATPRSQVPRRPRPGYGRRQPRVRPALHHGHRARRRAHLARPGTPGLRLRLRAMPLVIVTRAAVPAWAWHCGDGEL